MLSKDLLDILCCPKCHGDLAYETDKKSTNESNGSLTCKSCHHVYLVKDDIPIMLVEDETVSDRGSEQSGT